MCEEMMSESPAPWETGTLTDPIEVYDMIIVEDEETSQPSSNKPNTKFHKKLIRWVRRHPVLYDPAHTNFTNAECRKETWNKIAKRLDCDVDECRNAWVNLRYSYQKYVRRLRKFFANKVHKKHKRRPVMAYETDMIFLWRFIRDKIHCPLPYESEKSVEEILPVQHVIDDDDDIVLLEDDVEVIDLEDETANVAKVFAKRVKFQFQITPEIRRLIANIEPYQELYDAKHRYYEDYRRKGIIWNAIANEVGDKATKLMKCWIQLQTRYEWELMQRKLQRQLCATKPETELESLLAFFKPYILEMPKTVYKTSYYLKEEWHEPIDHFKNIYSLLVAMKKYPSVITLTDAMTTKSDEIDTEKYKQTWTDVASVKGSKVTPGQCESSWLILRTFYWELINMRKHSYQLQDKWYFEMIISELYSLANAQKLSRVKSKQSRPLVVNTNASVAETTKAAEAREPTPTPPPPTPLNQQTTTNTNTSTTNTAPQLVTQPVQVPLPILNMVQLPKATLSPNSIVPISVNLDEDKITSSRIETKGKQIKNITVITAVSQQQVNSMTTTTANTVTSQASSGVVVSLAKAPIKSYTAAVKQQEAQMNNYPQSRSPQIRVKSQAQLQADPNAPLNSFVQTRPQLQIQTLPTQALQQQQQQQQQQQTPQSQPIQIRLQTQTAKPTQMPNPLQTISLPRMPQAHQTHIQMLPLMPIQAQTKTIAKMQANAQTPPQMSQIPQIIPANVGQLLPPATLDPPQAPIPVVTLPFDTLKTPKIVSAVSLAPRNAFSAPFVNKGLQITALSTGGAGTATPSPPVLQSVPTTISPQTSLVMTPITEPKSLPPLNTGFINLPFQLPDNTNIVKCPPLSSINTNTTTNALVSFPSMTNNRPNIVAAPKTNLATNNGNAKPLPDANSESAVESKASSSTLARPHLTPTSQLNANEIMIELISSVNGNQLVVHGPPLEQKYSLPMSTTALLIREVLSIPYLHKKDYNKPAQINMCWMYLAKRFNLPVHICKACWNFLSENFAHFPQIAPMEELTKPVKLGIKVWRENYSFFKSMTAKAAQMRLTKFKGIVEKFFDNIRHQTQVIPRVSGKKLTFVADWQSAIHTDSNVTNRMWFDTWGLFRNAFIKYMKDLEIGIDNKWPLEWWRVLAKLDFLIEEQYTNMEPFYYIVRNKMIAECERCTREEQKYYAMKEEPSSSMLLKVPDIDAYRVILAVRRYPQIYQKASEKEKNQAWEQVAQELGTTSRSCRAAFQYALKMYQLYRIRDPASRCRLNQRYFKHFAEIYRAIKPTRKLNIKTPTELNQSVGENADANESVFPERFIMDINMSNSSSNVVMKNWAFGVASSVSLRKLEEIFNKYRNSDTTSAS
ncbi:uncharacterized protein LOC101459591 isoform X2 [Ceratitis capitata]|uniref:uncharacterized protein LOC101459591 isoform X2 n=1 Tax=Ceratitis capitata TaxID=7213 RepID=UPI000329723F|nr:uncharacterized protein LOC101459591 isoform X2 [Ceratitis capitata]